MRQNCCIGINNFLATLNRILSSSSFGLMQAAELRKTERRLQEELNGVYKEKAKLAQDYVAITKQLQIVRENFEQHDKLLTDRANTIKELKSSKKELVAQLDHLREANGEAVREMQVRLDFPLALQPPTGESHGLQCSLSLSSHFCLLTALAPQGKDSPPEYVLTQEMIKTRMQSSSLEEGASYFLLDTRTLY